MFWREKESQPLKVNYKTGREYDAIKQFILFLYTSEKKQKLCFTYFKAQCLQAVDTIGIYSK